VRSVRAQISEPAALLVSTSGRRQDLAPPSGLAQAERRRGATAVGIVYDTKVTSASGGKDDKDTDTRILQPHRRTAL